jgi:hypothetical protein
VLGRRHCPGGAVGEEVLLVAQVETGRGSEQDALVGGDSGDTLIGVPFCQVASAEISTARTSNASARRRR